MRKTLDITLMHPAEQINMVIGRIYKNGMTTTSGGNISIKDDNGDIWITPSRVDKGSLTIKDIVCLKKDGTITGLHKPSSEYPFHKAIYHARPELKSIIHAHPPALVAFSIARKTPDTKITPNSHYICGDVGFAPYGVPGSADLGSKIANEFKDSSYKAVIMENHGVVLGGTDLLDAYKRFETLEFCCRTLVNAKRLGNIKYLKEEQIMNYGNQTPKTKSNLTDAGHPSDEKALRSEMATIIRRACNQELMISTYGTVSARCNRNDFLITPNNVARWDILPSDIVLMKSGIAEKGKTPSHSAALHQRIYELNPHINSIICSQPVNLMAHAVSGTKLDVRTIPESWIFLQDVPSIQFEMIHNDIDQVAKMFSRHRAIIVENDSVFITGDQLINTFDYLEVAEFSANSLVMATSIGELCPMGDEEIEDLRRVFNVK